MEVTTINFYYIFKFILLLLALFGAFYIVKDIINAIKSCFKDKLEHNLIEKLTEKDVKIITAENSKDIHELTRQFEDLTKRIEQLEGVTNANNRT